MKKFIYDQLTNEDLHFIEKIKRTQIPGKLECKELQRIWQKIEDRNFVSNCFCSSSTRQTFRKMFFEMYDEYLYSLDKNNESNND